MGELDFFRIWRGEDSIHFSLTVCKRNMGKWYQTPDVAFQLLSRPPTLKIVLHAYVVW